MIPSYLSYTNEFSKIAFRVTVVPVMFFFVVCYSFNIFFLLIITKVLLTRIVGRHINITKESTMAKSASGDISLASTGDSSENSSEKKIEKTGRTGEIEQENAHLISILPIFLR